MITVKGKAIDHQEALKLLIDLRAKLQNAKENLRLAEREVISYEDDIVSVKAEIADIEAQAKCPELNGMLPTGLLFHGFKLEADGKRVILRDSQGEAVKEWDYTPSLTELFEVKP